MRLYFTNNVKGKFTDKNFNLIRTRNYGLFGFNSILSYPPYWVIMLGVSIFKSCLLSA